MVFWGFEVKPGKPQTCNPKDEQGKIHVTQATLGPGLSKEKSVIQCSIGDKAPIFLCSLMPNKTECCPLNLEFDDNDESVEFLVTGDRSIHLSGFLEYYQEDEDDSEYDEDASDGIDIGESETDNSCEYDSEEDHLDEFEDFLDSNLEMYRNASAPKSGVVIEEIEDEDDDGLPKGKAHEPENKSAEKMDVDTDKQGSNKKRKAKASESDVVPESANDSKKKKKQKEKKKAKNASNEEAGEQVQTVNTKAQNGNVNNAMSESSKSPAKSAEKKNKKKEKNSTEEATVEKEAISNVRTHPNGLIVEELSMGKPNGKRADPGKMVSVRYIGKLQKNGKIFDSNIGKSPFKFRLGVGQVIKGWDVGVNGMRVGDKRKLTIPPSMGYGAKGAGGQIPPNAWLTFDVELINVQ